MYQILRYGEKGCATYGRNGVGLQKSFILPTCHTPSLPTHISHTRHSLSVCAVQTFSTTLEREGLDYMPPIEQGRSLFGTIKDPLEGLQ